MTVSMPLRKGEKGSAPPHMPVRFMVILFVLYTSAWLVATPVLMASHREDRPSGIDPGYCISAEESELVRLINEYRQSLSLPVVQISKSLTAVAQHHVVDLYNNRPEKRYDNRGSSCNIHSWSGNGNWNRVCYTPDHSYGNGMWNKPREITSNVYSGNGYENAYWHKVKATASGAFNGWKNSSTHHDLIAEKGIWSGSQWPAMGIAIYKNYAVLWFGDQSDPQGAMTPCQTIYAASQ